MMASGVNRMRGVWLRMPSATLRRYNGLLRHPWSFAQKASSMIMPREHVPEPIRHDLVARVRREIRQGGYETPEKLEIALERLALDLERMEVEIDPYSFLN